MADASVTALVTGGTAILSGMLGYGTARGQQLIERHRLTSEDQRARDEWGRADQDQERVARSALAARREELYLEYLRSLDAYVLMVTSSRVNPDVYSGWWQGFQSLDNKMDLFATDEVVRANNAVYAELNAVSGALSSSETFTADVRGLFSDRREAFERARAQLVTSMRSEVFASARVDGTERTSGSG